MHTHLRPCIICMHYHNNRKILAEPTSKSLLIAMSDLFPVILFVLLSLLIFSTLPSSALPGPSSVLPGHVGPPSAAPALAPGPAGAPPEDVAFIPTVEQAALLPFIQPACNATRNPPKCVKILAQSNKVPRNPKTLQIVQASIWVAYQDLKVAENMVQSILTTAPPGPPSINLTNAAQNSVEYYKNAELYMRQTIDALQRGRTKDARAWLTASQVYEYDVWSALKYVNNSQLVNSTMAFTYDLINKTGNALAMTNAYDIFGSDLKTWQRPATERDGYWEPDTSADSGWDSGDDAGSDKVPFIDLKPDVTVCKNGTCKFKTIQEAVDAAPSNGKGYVIGIKAGLYDESVRVPLPKKNMVFIGDGMGKTIITGNKTATTPGVSTFNTATVGVKGDGFMATGLTVQNTAGPDAQQAVAFMSDSDQTVVENCEFLGNQDTLYAHSLRQFYKACRIVGNVDFIFGNSASIFEDCTILIKPRQSNPEKGETNCVTAHGRIDPSQTSGLILRNCLISGTQDFLQLYHSNPVVHKNFLGRPWKEFARTVYINCIMEDLIIPDGWSPWTGDQGLATCYYAEFNSTGLGANPKRVPWSNQLPANHVNAYSAVNFIQGQEWIPKASRLSKPRPEPVPTPTGPPLNLTGPPVPGTSNLTGPLAQGASNLTGPSAQGSSNSTGTPALGASNSTGPPAQGASNSTGTPALGASNSTGPLAQGASNSTGTPALGASNSTGPPAQGASNFTRTPAQGVSNSKEPPAQGVSKPGPSPVGAPAQG